MNAGAQVASGDVFLFLHADTVLPANFVEVISRALACPAVVGGRFDVRLDSAGWIFRMIETLINFRSRLTHIATGDQGIFIRRAVFLQLGGYPEIPLMEDLELSKKMKQAGEVACLQERVITSARRWQRNGVLRTVLLMWVLKLCHYVGVSPARLKAFYADTR
jgi:rSAM/selenodomain-associated transferase 2